MTARQAPLRALYIGYTKGTDNHGDEALIWIIRDLLAPEIEVVIGSDEFDIALLGGGTLINQSPWLIDVFGPALDKTGRGLIIGTGVGDLTFWGNRFARWAPLLNRCDFVGVRGPDSLTLLKEHGVTGAVCVGDPYLWLRSPAEREPIPRHLGVNLGSTNNSLWGTNDQDFLDYVTAVLAKLRERGWSFIWVSVWSRDIAFIESVRRKVDPDSPPVLDARTQPLETFSAISACDVFVGEKLHANAMAAIAGVPFVALEYQPKVRDFARSVALGEWVVSAAERDPQVLIDLIETQRSQREALKVKMTAARDELRKRLSDFVMTIKTHYTKVRNE